MKLSLSQIRSITCGASRVEEAAGQIRFYRFTASQAEAYLRGGHTDLFCYTTAPAGVRLAFSTDSTTLSFHFIRTLEASIRSFFSFDLYQNGQLTDHRSYDCHAVIEETLSFSLQPGEKEVELYLPWSTAISFDTFSLEDGASLQPLKRQGTLLTFGDSITQGYDATHASLSYVNRLGRLLNLDVINKGVAGDIFRADILTEAEEDPIDLITVAYGTNDWGGHTRSALTENARRFFCRLRQLYPKTKIYAISPIYRIDGEEEMAFAAPCYEVDSAIRDACIGLDISVINAWRFVPALPEFFWDRQLHPNDAGFAEYAMGIYQQIRSYI